MKLYHSIRLLTGALFLASVAGLRSSSSNDPLEVLRKLISSSNVDVSAAMKESLGSLNSKLVPEQFEQQHDRHLQTGRQCGEVVASVTFPEVQALLAVYISYLFPADGELAQFAETAEQILFANVKYGFEAVKLCMSCEEAMDMDVLTNEQLTSTEPYSYSSYCSADKYGYGAVRSDQIYLSA
jgi:hypothetical protein